jgi:hypothetical protein
LLFQVVMKTAALLGLAFVACSSSAPIAPSTGAGFNLEADKTKLENPLRFGRFRVDAPRGYEVKKEGQAAALVKEGVLVAMVDMDPVAQARDPEGCARFAVGLATQFASNALSQAVDIEPGKIGVFEGGQGCGFVGVVRQDAGVAVITSVLQRPEAFGVVVCMFDRDDARAQKDCAQVVGSVTSTPGA